AGTGSGPVSLLVSFGAGMMAREFGAAGSEGRTAFEAAALALPFVSLCQVYLGGTQGLKIMRYTVGIFWAGQPAAWIVLMALGWIAARTLGMSVLAYALSWVVATAAAWFAWERSTRSFGRA